MVHYDGEDYFLRAVRKIENHTVGPCISMRCRKGQEHEVLNKVYRFASVFGWFNNGYVDITGHITGSRPILYSAGSQNRTPTAWRMGLSCNHMPLIRDDNSRRALAFWREGMRLEHFHDGYAFLSFYKVIESQFDHGGQRKRWIGQALMDLSGDARDRVNALGEEGFDVSKHIFESGRCAVAHASLTGEVVDPDIPADRIRLTKDLVVVKALAEKYIREELGVPDRSDVHCHRDRLQPLYSYMRPEHVDELKQGGSVLRRKIGLNGLRVAINCWPNAAAEPFTGLGLTVHSAHNGLVLVCAENDRRTLQLVFLLDFTKGRAHTNIDQSGFVAPADGGQLEDAVVYLEYYKSVLGNGIIEVMLPNGEKIDCEIVIPVNIDLSRTFSAVDKQIAALREQNTDIPQGETRPLLSLASKRESNGNCGAIATFRAKIS